MKTIKNFCLPLLASLALGLGCLSGTVYAQSPTPIGTVANIPAGDINSYGVSSLRYDSSGNLYAWDGLSVWKSSGGTGSFTYVGSVASGNSADPGPITLSQDGTTLLLSNGGGGQLAYSQSGYNGEFFTMPVAGAGSATQVTGSGVPNTWDAIALPATTISGSATKYLVDEGSSPYGSSSLSIFDAVTGTNKIVVSGIPGASTSIAYNPTNESVYVGPSGGEIYSFRLSDIAASYNSTSGTMMAFSSGTPFNQNGNGYQSGEGMFFDNNGYLFSGGWQGITVFRPDGTISYDTTSLDNTLTYDPANNDVLYVPYGSSTGILYSATEFETVPEPSTFALLGAGALAGLVAWRKRRS